MLSFTKVKKRFPEARAVQGKNGVEYNVHCPEFHRKGGRYKLYINSESGAAYCQDCSFSINAIQRWFDDAEDMIDALAIERDADLVTILDKSSRPKEGNFAKRGGAVWEDDVPSPGHLIPFKDLDDEHPAVEYLHHRGFDIDEIRNFDKGQALYYCDKEGVPLRCGSTKGRIIFPIYMDGLLKGWQARKIDKVTAPVRGEMNERRLVWDGQSWTEVFKSRNNKWTDHNIPKYLTCPLMARADVLYGYDQARKEKTSDNHLVVVVEGPLDQMKVGYPSVATLGGMSQHQLRLILTYWSTAVIIHDPEIDPNAEKFQRVLSSLSAIQTCHLKLSNGLDPGGTDRKVIWNEITKEMHRREYDIPANLRN